MEKKFLLKNIYNGNYYLDTSTDHPKRFDSYQEAEAAAKTHFELYPQSPSIFAVEGVFVAAE